MSSLDGLRVAAIAYAEAQRRRDGLVQFGAGVADAERVLKGATKALVLASDLHGARARDGLCDLIRTGHTIESANRLIKLRGDDRKAPRRRKFVKRAQAARRRKR